MDGNERKWVRMEEEGGNSSARGTCKTDVQIKLFILGKERGGERSELDSVHIKIDYWTWFFTACM